MFKNKTTILVVISAMIVIAGYINDREETSYYESKGYKESITVPQPLGPINKYRGWDYKRSVWVERQGSITPPSDADIRQIKEELQYKENAPFLVTPGRNIRTLEKEIEKYLDDHGEEIYEELESKYGDK